MLAQPARVLQSFSPPRVLWFWPNLSEQIRWTVMAKAEPKSESQLEVRSPRASDSSRLKKKGLAFASLYSDAWQSPRQPECVRG
jgi:hypothetical protein